MFTSLSIKNPVFSKFIHHIVNCLSAGNCFITKFTFCLRNQTYPAVCMGNVNLLEKDEVEYLGMHVRRRVTYAKHKNPKGKKEN